MSRIEKALEKATRERSGSAPELLTSRPVEPSLQIMRLLDVNPLQIENPMLTAAGLTDAFVNEEYNKLRSLVINQAKGETFRNALLVTSSISGEGKTVTALNLSLALAREYDHTVLLVDADLRRPSVHSYLGIKSNVGLIQCLKGEVPLEHALIKTGIGKLVVLPAGGTVEDPVELLSSNLMKEIVRELKTRYSERFVLFDSPPAMNFADAQVLADIVDGTIFVVREGSVSKTQLEKILRSFQDKNLLGVVFNDVSMPVLRDSYYY